MRFSSVRLLLRSASGESDKRKGGIAAELARLTGMIYNMKQFKPIFVWASIQYAVHVDGATVHVTGPDERQVEFGDGTTSFATLSGGEGYINSTVTVNAPDFVTMTGTSVNEMMTLIREQQAEIASLKQFVGMMPPSPPLAPHLPQMVFNRTIPQGSGSGWSYDQMTCGVHGIWGSNIRQNAYSLTGIPTHSFVTVRTAFITTGSRDGERDYFDLDGTETVSYATNYVSCDQVSTRIRFSNVLSSNYSCVGYEDGAGWVPGPDGSGWVPIYVGYSPTGSRTYDTNTRVITPDGCTAWGALGYGGKFAIIPIEVTISHTDSSLHLRFRSELDEGLVNEGWGFNPVEVYAYH